MKRFTRMLLTLCGLCCAGTLCRCRHRVPLGLSGVPGVWLVEVVAGSRRLRARVSKGGLQLWQRPSVAGQVLTIMDEEWRPVTVRGDAVDRAGLCGPVSNSACSPGKLAGLTVHDLPCCCVQPSNSSMRK